MWGLRRNLARLDEIRIDYDLIEALISHLHAASDDGAVLVFLPGKSSDRCDMVHMTVQLVQHAKSVAITLQRCMSMCARPC